MGSKDSRGWVIHRYDSVASTMDVAARLARCGARERTAIVSRDQTAGRGRAGRSWQAPPGSALFCTLILRPRVAPDRLSTLPLVTGVAVAEAVEQITGATVQLKWPNDVWIGKDPERRKTGGILATSALAGGCVDFALVGIGINVSAEIDALPPGATSLLAATGARCTPDDLFETILARFDLAYEAFGAAEGRPSLDGWRARAALLGEPVTIEDAGRVHAGIYAGDRRRWRFAAARSGVRCTQGRRRRRDSRPVAVASRAIVRFGQPADRFQENHGPSGSKSYVRSLIRNAST